MLQTVALRRANEPDGVGDVVILHAPAQILPKANSSTILSRQRAWGVFTSVGTSEWYGGTTTFQLFKDIPLTLKVHCDLATACLHFSLVVATVDVVF